MIFFGSNQRRGAGGCVPARYRTRNSPQTKKARVDQQNKAYEGKHHKVAKEGEVTIGGAKGNYILTTWKEKDKDMEKHTAQHLKDGNRYMVVLWGEKGKVDKKVFDEAVKTFALAKP